MLALSSCSLLPCVAHMSHSASCIPSAVTVLVPEVIVLKLPFNALLRKTVHFLLNCSVHGLNQVSLAPPNPIAYQHLETFALSNLQMT